MSAQQRHYGQGQSMMDLNRKTTGAARVVAVGAIGLLVAGCSDFPSLNLVNDPAKAEDAAQTQTETTLIERDVEAPEVFDVTESGLWDGRPSLGGVWVAHPDVEEPERVIIRNTTNGKFVIGALFRRERDIPGPRLQASSDAAEALGMLAGAPVLLNVTALRRETVEEPSEEVVTEELTEAVDVEEVPLDPIAGDAAAAIAASEETPTIAIEAETSETVIAAAAPAPVTPAAVASTLSKPYIQIGIFSVETNANRSADMMRTEGMVPTVYKQEMNGKTFWRVVVGPAATSSERSALLAQIKNAGFTDAYAVNE